MMNVKAIILVGSRDFGRCPLASRLSTPLWPVVGRTVLERLLTHLAEEGIRQVVVCSGEDDSSLAESIQVDHRLNVEFMDEPLPVGTAGCLRDAIRGEEETLLLVFSASIVSPPEIDALIDAHSSGKSDLTVFLNPECGDDSRTGQATGIYACESRVLEHIPEAGYVDIKESLIPEMLREGKMVHAATLPKPVGNFRDWQGYLYAIDDYLEREREGDKDIQGGDDNTSTNVKVAATANIDPSARIQGPVIVMEDATVSPGAVVLGPTVLGRRVTIGQDSVVVNSVVWDDAQIGPNCGIRRSVIDDHAVVQANALVEDGPVVLKPSSFLGRLFDWTKNNITGPVLARWLQITGISGSISDKTHVPRESIFAYLAAIVLLVVFIWSYQRGLGDLFNLWQRSDEYSVGMIVPFLALYILWTRRRVITEYPIKPSIWGFVLFVGAQVIRFFGLFFMYSSAERFSIVLSIAGIVLLLFGWQLFRKVAPILLFLCLMLPPPNFIQSYTVLHLQRWATSSAVFCLEMVGCEVIQEGNTIHIGETSVEVAYACNGLRMITAFFVISGLVVLMVKRVWWEKLIILVSSLPIALMCNTVRLTITALALTQLNDEFWNDKFHDFGGYAMMPLALAIVVGELWLLTKLTTLPVTEEAVIITRQKA